MLVCVLGVSPSHKSFDFAAKGRSYLCKRLDLERRLALVCPANLKYYTKTVDYRDVCVVGSHGAAFKPPVRCCLVGLQPRH